MLNSPTFITYLNIPFNKNNFHISFYFSGIAIGKDGNVFVIDDRRVRVLGNDGGIDNYVGTNSIDFTSLKKGRNKNHQ